MASKKVCFIQSTWHKDIVDQLKLSFVNLIKEKQNDIEIDFIEVPGALEIPLQAQKAIQTKQYQAIVVAGLIVNGGIYRHEFVAQATLDAIMKIQLETGTPIIYGILTPINFHGETHEKFFFDHFKIKGEEAARACDSILAIDK